jgi:hypothetical protein
MRTIILYDATGTQIHSEAAKSAARRWSAQAAADQRQIDAARALRPTAVRAELKVGSTAFQFTFDPAGRSQAVFA